MEYTNEINFNFLKKILNKSDIFSEQQILEFISDCNEKYANDYESVYNFLDELENFSKFFSNILILSNENLLTIENANAIFNVSDILYYLHFFSNKNSWKIKKYELLLQPKPNLPDIGKTYSKEFLDKSFVNTYFKYRMQFHIKSDHIQNLRIIYDSFSIPTEAESYSEQECYRLLHFKSRTGNKILNPISRFITQINQYKKIVEQECSELNEYIYRTHRIYLFECDLYVMDADSKTITVKGDSTKYHFAEAGYKALETLITRSVQSPTEYFKLNDFSENKGKFRDFFKDSTDRQKFSNQYILKNETNTKYRMKL